MNHELAYHQTERILEKIKVKDKGITARTFSIQELKELEEELKSITHFTGQPPGLQWYQDHTGKWKYYTLEFHETDEFQGYNPEEIRSVLNGFPANIQEIGRRLNKPVITTYQRKSMLDALSELSKDYKAHYINDEYEGGTQGYIHLTDDMISAQQISGHLNRCPEPNPKVLKDVDFTVNRTSLWTGERWPDDEAYREPYPSKLFIKRYHFPKRAYTYEFFYHVWAYALIQDGQLQAAIPCDSWYYGWHG